MTARPGVDALFGRRFGSRSKASWPMMLEPASMPFFHLFQALLLFRRENRRNLAVRFGDCFTDAPAGVASILFELRARLFDDRRNLAHLSVGPPILPLQSVLHCLSGKPATMC